MKQNSRIMFHLTIKSLKSSYLCRLRLFAATSTFCVFAIAGATAAEKPEYLVSFNPAKGFKPAQSDLTEVFLQIAGSLEYYGSPEPYLRHMQAEHQRIEAKYHERFGTTPKSYRPAYMTDAYFEQLSATRPFMPSSEFTKMRRVPGVETERAVSTSAMAFCKPLRSLWSRNISSSLAATPTPISTV